jgi:WhiB family redox-sensing transcriptional regulator|tara:strand:+ start:2205 stop:2474 length:270 start_codon:yes stop_codon:yes gene_type:complete
MEAVIPLPVRYQGVEWIEFANCKGADPGLFFPTESARTKVTEARKLCEACAVKEICLSEAMNDPSVRGVWGGTTYDQRKRRRRLTGLPA